MVEPTSRSWFQKMRVRSVVASAPVVAPQVAKVPPRARLRMHGPWIALPTLSTQRSTPRRARSPARAWTRDGW
jgi:hypothetical protein